VNKSESFNKTNKVGTKFNYYPIKGLDKKVPVESRSQAWDMCGSVVVKVTGRTGGVDIDHLEVV
jgi:hypothetical protein